jgi:hypothetical protein
VGWSAPGCDGEGSEDGQQHTRSKHAGLRKGTSGCATLGCPAKPRYLVVALTAGAAVPAARCRPATNSIRLLARTAIRNNRASIKMRRTSHGLMVSRSGAKRAGPTDGAWPRGAGAKRVCGPFSLTCP